MDQLMHLVIKYNDSVYGVDTIEKHKEILREQGIAIWGIIKPTHESPGISKEKIKKVKSQIQNRHETYAYFVTGGKIIARGVIIDIYSNEKVKERSNLVPEYYRNDIDRCVAGILLEKIESIPEEVIDKLQRYGTNNEPVALSNQTNPLYVSKKPEEQKPQIIENQKEYEGYSEGLIHIDIKELTSHIYTYITSKGFYYEEDEVRNLILSMKSKPFVIISGVSGTGKTMIVRWLAESVGATSQNYQFTLIPVRPDWSDSSDLLGYTDIKGNFQEGPFTKVIKTALNNPNKPYFVLLDEMNLARVEHYFSDILSVMESRQWNGNRIITETLFPNDKDRKDIYFPDNIYLFGTVNMDETTHPFSKKVLDRANTIEFNRIKLDHLDFLTELEVRDNLSIHNKVFMSEYLHLKDSYKHHIELVERVTKELVEINKSLELIYAHVGYRVRDEICFYLAYNEKYKVFDERIALDNCILQKILPRIAGSDDRVERVLFQLYKIFTGINLIDAEDLDEDDLRKAKYPRSATKVTEMIRGLKDGFTSFWISS